MLRWIDADAPVRSYLRTSSLVDADGRRLGAVEEWSDGRWRAYLERPDGNLLVFMYGSHHLRTFATKGEAQAFVRERCGVADHGIGTEGATDG